jgi:hypothetical protein
MSMTNVSCMNRQLQCEQFDDAWSYLQECISVATSTGAAAQSVSYKRGCMIVRYPNGISIKNDIYLIFEIFT